MEIETHDSVTSGKIQVKVAFQLGTESYTIDATNKGSNIVEQLVSMKEESMKLLKEFITKQTNVPDDDDVIDEVLSDDEEGDDLKSLVKPKKTKI